MNKENLAPIALFVYNRLWHTQMTINALRENFLAKDSNLIIFSDGPRDNSDDFKKIEELREYLKKISGFKNVEIVIREKNYGLAKSIISGVTEVINKFGKIIVLEDDMVTSKYFLEYMNKALDIYEEDENVVSIHAHSYPVKNNLPKMFFLKGADCWGWATWSRGWDIFEADGQKLLNELKQKKLLKDFNFLNSYPYSKMLKNQIIGKNNSWAIRWYASAFLKNKYTLYPGESLIFNTGFDGSGTHCGRADDYNKLSNVSNVKIDVERIPIIASDYARMEFIKYFKKQSSIISKIIKRIKYVLKYELKIKKNN